MRLQGNTYERRFSQTNSAAANNSELPLTENQLLSKLPADLHATLAQFLRRVELTKEQFLYQAEDKLNYIYFPEKAVVSDFRTLEDGRMVEIAMTGKEGAIGLASLLSDTRIVANTVQVAQAGSAQRIDSSTLDDLLHGNERLRTHLIHCLDPYIKQISQRSICNMFHSVKERFCMWLLLIQDRCGRRKLTLTHEQIARVLGVYRPSVTCIAQELRTDKLIDYSRGGILLRDRPGIEDSSCPCYFELQSPALVH